ncbi:MAG TPA: LacI family DNA-binding transcriptional regulator [Fimbriimonadaceae bacterium]|nr:LacI family DNA-binding transcriptional regulator [Fimbriimonadaceae bacterium]
MAVTQEQVAQMAGVTRAVVSRVLHGGADSIRVSPETAERVRRVAAEMGYLTDAPARMSRDRRTSIIGILQGDGLARLRFASNPYYATLMDGIVDGAFVHGYTVGVCPELLGINPEGAMADGRFDGFIWYSTFASQAAEEYIKRSEAPIVVLHAGAQSLGNRFPTVICDNETGIRLAVEHLAELGHQRVGFLFDGRLRNSESAERGEYLFQFGQDHGLDVSFLDYAPGDTALEKYFDSHPKETAIVAHSEAWAADAMNCARRHGIKIPEDMSFIGFDSTSFCDYQSPPLTSIRQPLLEMGMRAVDVLVDLIDGKQPDTLETILPCGFDVRGSTGPAPLARAA